MRADIPAIASAAQSHAATLFVDAVLVRDYPMVMGIMLVVAVAAFGWSGEEAFQLFVPAGGGADVAAALEADAAVSRGDATLLENSQIVYGSNLSDGDEHGDHDLPIILAGGGGSVVI